MRKTILLSAIGLSLALSGAAVASSDNDGRSRHGTHAEKSRSHDDDKSREARSDRRDHRDGRSNKVKSERHDGDKDGDRSQSRDQKHRSDRRS